MHSSPDYSRLTRLSVFLRSLIALLLGLLASLPSYFFFNVTGQAAWWQDIMPLIISLAFVLLSLLIEDLFGRRENASDQIVRRLIAALLVGCLMIFTTVFLSWLLPFYIGLTIAFAVTSAGGNRRAGIYGLVFGLLSWVGSALGLFIVAYINHRVLGDTDVTYFMFVSAILGSVGGFVAAALGGIPGGLLRNEL